MLNSNIEIKNTLYACSFITGRSQYPDAINKTNLYYIFLELAQYFHSRNVCKRVLGTTVFYSSII